MEHKGSSYSKLMNGYSVLEPGIDDGWEAGKAVTNVIHALTLAANTTLVDWHLDTEWSIKGLWL